MRKISLFLFFALFLFSCSDSDESTVLDNNQNLINKEIDLNNSTYSRNNNIIGKYLEIQKSNDYLIFKNGVEKFASKFPKNVRLVFKNKNEMLNWINNNLDLTKFSSLEEVNNELDEISSLYAVIISKEQSFFHELASLSHEQIDVVFSTGIDSFDAGKLAPSSGGPCENECINDAVACSNAVNAAYNSSINLAVIMAESGNILGAAIVAAAATVTQNIGQSNCVSAFNACRN